MFRVRNLVKYYYYYYYYYYRRENLGPGPKTTYNKPSHVQGLQYGSWLKVRVKLRTYPGSTYQTPGDRSFPQLLKVKWVQDMAC